ncbi:MAG: hypothetical protein Q7S22_00800 [Candidatus Micrarchaeota archaeon]|nr:hypothetical protein [Candidatus Micrarchaeota archaeon]
MPTRGISELFSEKRFRTNSELFTFLRKSGFEIEHLTDIGSFERKPSIRVDKVRNGEWMILVAKKI